MLIIITSVIITITIIIRTTGEKKAGEGKKETCRDMSGLFKGLKCCQEEQGLDDFHVTLGAHG